MEINRFDLLDLKKSPPDYIINEIEARNGESLRYIHETAIKAPCYIINARRGERGLIMYLPDYDRDTYHRLHTSTVEDVIESVSGKDVIIVTKKPDTGLVSVMCVNNETGAINPVEDIATACMKRGVLFHTDCVQAAGCIKLDVQKIGCDFLSIASHKLNGPKGVGALYVKDTSILGPIIWGGHSQEYGYRGGTENVAGIVGFGEACRLYKESEGNYSSWVCSVKQEFYARLRERLGDDGFTLNGQSVLTPGKILSLTFDGVDAQTLVLMLDAKGVCVSTGSACNSRSMEPSHVLKGMGLSDEQANSTIRVSFSIDTKLEDARDGAEIMATCVTMLRNKNKGGRSV